MSSQLSEPDPVKSVPADEAPVEDKGDVTLSAPQPTDEIKVIEAIKIANQEPVKVVASRKASSSAAVKAPPIAAIAIIASGVAVIAGGVVLALLKPKKSPAAPPKATLKPKEAKTVTATSTPIKTPSRNQAAGTPRATKATSLTSSPRAPKAAVAATSPSPVPPSPPPAAATAAKVSAAVAAAPSTRAAPEASEVPVSAPPSAPAPVFITRPVAALPSLPVPEPVTPSKSLPELIASEEVKAPTPAAAEPVTSQDRSPAPQPPQPTTAFVEEIDEVQVESATEPVVEVEEPKPAIEHSTTVPAEVHVQEAEGEAKEEAEGEAEEEAEEEEEEELSDSEMTLKKLYEDAVTSWNMEKKNHALKLGKQAVELIKQGGIRAKFIAVTANAVSDMLFNVGQMEEADACCKISIDAATECKQHGLVCRLFCNRAAARRTKDKYDEALSLYEEAEAYSIRELGVTHPASQLVRTHKVECLDLMNKRTEAREFLRSCIATIEEEEAKAKAALLQAGLRDDFRPLAMKPPPSRPPPSEEGGGNAPPQPPPPEEEEEEEVEADDPPEVTALLRARMSFMRTQVDLARLEIRDSDHPAAVLCYRSAIDKCHDIYGQVSPEAGIPMFALGNLYRTMKRNQEALDVFLQLYEVVAASQGKSSDSSIGLARSICEVNNEMGNHAKAAEYAEMALSAMQQRVPGGFHPALESYYRLVIECKTRAGDAEGAEKLKKQFLRASVQFQAEMSRNGGRGAGPSAGRGRGRR